MTTAQLGPPPVAASRGSAPPSGRAAGDSATGNLVETEDGGFVAVLDGHSAPGASDAPDQAQNPNAAGPLTGELPTEVVADADASPDTTVAPADVAAVIAAAVVTAAPAAALTASSSPAAAVVATGAAQAAPPQPLPGVVPAVLDGDGAVAPAPANPAAAPAATATAPAAGAPIGAPAPAATLTLTLSQVAAPSADGSADGAPAPVATKEVPVPAATPRPAGQDAAAVTAKVADTPAPSVAMTAAPAIPHVSPLDGLTRAGALTTPHELARELGHRVQMAVREGGRELLINLRPPDLGHLTIRVTMTEGVLQAQIIADRPEAARMLQQSLSHLGAALGDLGYSLDSLDVAYSGQDPRDAHASARGQGAAGGDAIEADGPAAGSTSSTTPAGDAGRLDLLA